MASWSKLIRGTGFKVLEELKVLLVIIGKNLERQEISSQHTRAPLNPRILDKPDL